MKTLYLTVLFLLSFALISSAQTFSPLKTAKQQNLKNIGDMQIAFEEWSVSQKPLTIKGNKPFHRWMWFNQMRFSDDPRKVELEYLKTGQNISNQKTVDPSFKLNAWIPAGPVDLVPSTSESPIHDLGRLNCIAFHPTDVNTFWVGAPQGGIWKTVDGGQNYMPLGDNLPSMRISDIAVDHSNPDVMYICLGDYGYMGFFSYYVARSTHYGLGVYKTVDGGETWNPTALTFIIEDGMESLMRRVFINPENTLELVAAGVSGIYKSQDGGDNWILINSSFIWDFEQDPANYQVIYATKWEYSNGISGILKSTDFGQTWDFLDTGIPQTDTVLRIEVTVAPSDNNYVYAACGGFDDAFYAFYRSTDGGQSWIKTADSSEVNIFGQTNGAPDNKLAQSSYDLWVMVDEYNPEVVYTGAMNIWGSSDGGENWDPCSFGLDYFGESIHFDHHDVRKNPLDNKLYFCCDGGLFRTDSLVIGNIQQFDSCWSGNYLYPECFQFETEWENLSAGLVITEFYRLGLSYNNPGYVIAGSQDNCIYFKNDADDWVNLTQGDGMESMLHPDDPNILYASNQFGVLYKSVDGGVNMSGYPITYPIIGQEGLGVWVTPFQMDQQTPETIYAGFRNVWQSINSGTSWTKISDFSNMPGYNLPKPVWDMALCTDNPEVIYVSKQPWPAASLGFPGELWRTTNGGQVWENITPNVFSNLQNYINDIAVSENPNKAYIVATGFEAGKKVFETNDGGQSWANISGSLPNIAVTSIVHQQASASNDLYIGTDLGVFYKNDELPDWELFSDNLPNVIVNELEIDYNESKLYAATYGRGIWFANLLNPITGIDDQNSWVSTMEVSLLPNPCTDYFVLNFQNKITEEIEMEIIDILGNIKSKEVINANNYSKGKQFDIRDFPAGLYFLRLSAANQSKVCRFVKR